MPSSSPTELDTLQKRLLQRFENDQLAHFYLLRAHPHERDPQAAIETWLQQFLECVWRLQRPQTSESFTQHPDFLIIKNPKPQRAYQSRENPGLHEWAKTQDYGPMELKRRWIVLHHAQTLTESFCNKQLKTLEEPNENTTVILTDPQQAPLLKTIESRAIKIQIPRALNPRELKRASAAKDFLNYLTSLGTQVEGHPAADLAQMLQGPVHEALEWMRARPELELSIVEWVLDFERSRCDAQQISALLQRLKWFEKSRLLHNSAQERWLTLLSPYLPS